MQGGADRHRLGGETQTSGLDPRDIQHLVDETEEMPAGPEHVLHALALVRGKILDVQELSEPQDGVERRPQLMAHARQELALRPVRPISFEPGLLERLFGGFAGGGILIVAEDSDRLSCIVVLNADGGVDPAVAPILIQEAILGPVFRFSVLDRFCPQTGKRPAIVRMDVSLPKPGGREDLLRGVSTNPFGVGACIDGTSVCEIGFEHHRRTERDQVFKEALPPACFSCLFGDPLFELRVYRVEHGDGPGEDQDVTNVGPDGLDEADPLLAHHLVRRDCEDAQPLRPRAHGDHQDRLRAQLLQQIPVQGGRRRRGDHAKGLLVRHDRAKQVGRRRKPREAPLRD